MMLTKFNPFHWFPEWKTEEIEGPKPESPFDKEIERALSLGFDVGALVYPKRLEGSQERFITSNWSVIIEVTSKGRISQHTKNIEIFNLRSLNPNIQIYNSGTVLYGINELVLIQAAPKFRQEH